MLKWLISKAIRKELEELDHELRKALNRIESLEQSRTMGYQKGYRAAKKKHQEESEERTPIASHQILQNPEVMSFIGMLPPEERQSLFTQLGMKEDGNIPEDTEDSEQI